MDSVSRPWRSVLYIPASRERALEKARSLPVDAIIFDLEDAVAPEEKPAGRALLAETLAKGGYGARASLVRINDLGTDWARDDISAVAACSPDAILLPKVNGASDIEALAGLMERHEGFRDTAIWAMMETPAGILNAAEIATAPRMAGFVFGTNDLAKELQCDLGGDRSQMMTSLQICLLAARAAGIICIDGVYNAFKDEDGLRAECAQGRSLGMDGKSLIHPAQVAIANDIFRPSAEDVDLARRQIEAFDDALAKGEAVAVVDGKIVENLHVATAHATLAKAEAIAAMEQS